MTLDKFSIAAEPDVLWPRVAGFVSDAIAALDSAERERRICWCREHGRHGVSVERVEGELVFVWADAVLFTLDPRALLRSIGTAAELS
jgi:hypothetical protein